jgi:hypothetical protein
MGDSEQEIARNFLAVNRISALSTLASSTPEAGTEFAELHVAAN